MFCRLSHFPAAVLSASQLKLTELALLQRTRIEYVERLDVGPQVLREATFVSVTVHIKQDLVTIVEH